MEKVGLLGLGIMGSAMSSNLIKAGYQVIGYDPLEKQVARLESLGGKSADNPREVAEQCPAIITSLPTVEVLQRVVQGDQGLIHASRQGLIVIECSTFPLSAKNEARIALERSGTIMLDCPLSGTGAQAEKRDIVILASGDEAACKQCEPVFQAIGRATHYLGTFGAGSKMKFVANLLVAVHNVSAAEAFVMGMKGGLDPETMYRVISDSAGSSRRLEVRGPMMVAGEYEPATMKLGVFQKDIAMIRDFARQLGSPTPLLDASAGIYDQANSMGWENWDTGAVCALLEHLAGWSRGGKSAAD
ncbi:MAG: NAD(P)-dependent oxidoreductase [Deltaproteobacteria bacterium]|nr:NAD(P)-dependent oxidoreductase [Deltaproteobacteria bacterium]